MSSSIVRSVTFALGVAGALGGVACIPLTRTTAIADRASEPAASRSQAPADEARIESFAVPGSGIERVRVTVAVRAPIDRVRAVIFDYARYPDFMPRYEKAAVLKITPDGGRLVRMELGGIVRLWMRVEISPPRSDGAMESYVGRLVAGNVKAFAPRWELTPLDGRRTQVMVESFLDPDLMFVPSALINASAREGMREAIVALEARIEGEAAR